MHYILICAEYHNVGANKFYIMMQMTSDQILALTYVVVNIIKYATINIPSFLIKTSIS